MNEKEKMLNGLLYDANYDEILIKERIKCKSLCHKYNNLLYENITERKAILKQILGKTKENFIIEPYFWCDYGYKRYFQNSRDRNSDNRNLSDT